VLKIPGDNGTPTAASFPLQAGRATVTSNTNTVYVKVAITTNDASRSMQVWYNNSNKPTAGFCQGSLGYLGGVLPTDAGNKEKVKEVALKVEH